jgi:hypothetical protein
MTDKEKEELEELLKDPPQGILIIAEAKCILQNLAELREMERRFFRLVREFQKNCSHEKKEVIQTGQRSSGFKCSVCKKKL